MKKKIHFIYIIVTKIYTSLCNFIIRNLNLGVLIRVLCVLSIFINEIIVLLPFSIFYEVFFRWEVILLVLLE
ncbi:hypothetical protein TRFO_29893 [Tritrichomonas foetus]|uniref:Uncharacterized protein n=1 Tax=Tritrichomonas foetus TaxID=1144522 RepID=A0A1J4JZZ7_9EUKA|nr:hypothetical protein TRFO_29893 [Tritrichomonas foetus]|eukprot:OHT02829.1 hypothetical protein TRFO_29893 [Tritrichomonas foetus]